MSLKFKHANYPKSVSTHHGIPFKHLNICIHNRMNTTEIKLNPCSYAYVRTYT